ncbi:MAG: hypothetical protein AABN34_24620 [Acidobacteriota bacterium]
MTRTVQQLLDTFDRLPEPEQREVASEILRRFRRIAVDPISNDELILSAENLFLEIDQREGNQ